MSQDRTTPPGGGRRGLETAEEVAGAVHGLVRDAFTAYTRYHQKKQEQEGKLFGLRMSSLGGCVRECAYRLSGTEPSDSELALDGENRAANVGTWIHEGLLPWMAAVAGNAGYEVKVSLRAGKDTVPGSLDLFVYIDGVLIDLKTGMEYDAHRMQVGGYALACQQDPDRETPRWVVWLQLDRTDRQVREKVVVEEWTEDYALEVLEHVWDIQRHAKAPDEAPRWDAFERPMRGPGLSYVCDGCPWLRRCWGEKAEPGQPGAQAVLAKDDPAVAGMLHRFSVHRSGESEDRGLKEFFRHAATGGGRKPGTYTGPDGTYEFWFGKQGSTPDLDQIRSHYRRWGIPVPMKPTAGKLHVKAIPDGTAGKKPKPRKREGNTDG
ncbi:hypothetical protein [Streptomyces sp. TR02-1]|uniref:hypothetical protein n=1 Tax=Streptomyces sp. TR02-1 TaxID=3385977 RepID=UPI0039A2D117